MRRNAIAAAVLAGALACSSCALVINGRYETVDFDSEPEGATVVVDGETIGRTPCSAELLRGHGHEATISLEGHKTWFVVFDPRPPGWVGALWGTFPATSGDTYHRAHMAGFSFEPDDVEVVMIPGTGQVEWRPEPE